MNFFFDNNVSLYIVRALGCLSEKDKHYVTYLRNEFAPNTDDVIWMSKLKKEGNWIIISGDTRIKRNPHEREAWLESGLTTFFLAKGWMNIPFWIQAQKLVRWWPLIVEQSQRVQSGNFFEVPVNGNKMAVIPKRQ